MSTALPSLRRDQALKFAIFAAGGAAAGRLEAIEIGARARDIAAGHVKGAGVAKGGDMVRIGGQRLAVPGPRLVVTPELRVGEGLRRPARAK